MTGSHSKLGMPVVLALTLGLTLGACSDDDKTVTGPDYPDDALVSQSVSTPPSSNASVDALWADVTGIDMATVVAPYDTYNSDGEDIWWDNYEGMTIDVNMKSVYTDTDIYFLFTWNDAEDSRTRQAWYCDLASGTWLQMGKKHPDEFGRPPAYEDKFTVFWNRSIGAFATSGCATLCHGPYMATNGAGEIADIWHWKRDRTAPVFQLDDKWLDNAQNGRHSDAGTGAYSDNKQDLTITGGATVSAPMYWIPGRTDYHWIMQTEIDDGTARLIVDMNVDGNWVDEDGIILDQASFEYDSDTVIPSLKGIKPATGSRGDVSAWHNWSNGTWTLKVKRARDTGSDDDVQFTQLGTPYWFSVGVMNAAAIAHATPGGLAGTPSQLILSE